MVVLTPNTNTRLIITPRCCCGAVPRPFFFLSFRRGRDLKLKKKTAVQNRKVFVGSAADVSYVLAAVVTGSMGDFLAFYA